MGKEFIVGFMENLGSSNLELFVTTPNYDPVQVTISTPKYSALGLPTTFTVRHGMVKHIKVESSLMMIGTRRDSKAVHISADDEIVVYGANRMDASTDAFLGIPTDILGNEYYTVSFSVYSRSSSQILIIGASDSITVNIKLPDILGSNYVEFNGVPYSQGQTINVVLDHFDTFQITSLGDLTGTHVQSNKPVAVFSGNQCARVGPGYCDHLVEMLMPVDTWGKTFATVPIPDRTIGDVFRFIANEPYTTVNIKGGISDSFTITKPGGIVERFIPSNAYCLIEANKAIMTVQFVQGHTSTSDLTDPSMMIVQPLGGYSNIFTFSTLSRPSGDFINYFALIIRSSNKDGLMIDGSPLSTTFHTIPGSDFVGGYIRIPSGVHTVYHQSPIALFAGYIYGRQRIESYAFPIGTRLAPINMVSIRYLL